MRHKKIVFRLSPDSDGYPPMDTESVWAQEADDGTYVLDNIPFFATEATLGDRVRATEESGELFYTSTAEESGNSLLRVVLFDDYDSSELRSQLKNMGCSSEQSHIPSLISVNIPRCVAIDEVRGILQIGSEQGFLDYEEPILRQ